LALLPTRPKEDGGQTTLQNKNNITQQQQHGKNVIQPPYYLIQMGVPRTASTFQHQLLMAIVSLKSPQVPISRSFDEIQQQQQRQELSNNGTTYSLLSNQQNDFLIEKYYELTLYGNTVIECTVVQNVCIENKTSFFRVHKN
jgi:hypothetical protein